MTKYFKDEFAIYGDKIEIPDDIQASGEVSYQTGFGIDYQRKLGVDVLAKPFPRQGFNGLISDITGAIKQYQQNGFFDFITPVMNGGTPYAYAMGACVRYDMSEEQDGSDVRNFSSTINDNTGNPKDNPDNWSDLSDSDIAFATNEETQAGIETGKAVTPAGLASVTATVDRRGLIQIATDEEVASGVNTTKAVTPASLENNEKQIGHNQTWINMTSERQINVSYINSSGKPIQIYVCADVATGALVIDDVNLPVADSAGYTFISAIIPNGSTYRINGAQSDIVSWGELR